MKKKLFIICLIVCVMCVFVFMGCKIENKIDLSRIACGELSIFSNEELDEMYVLKTEEREKSISDNVTLIELNACDAKKIGGIVCRKKDILMVDTENDCLLVVDKEGESVEHIGMTGNGPLEFLNPTGIAEHKGDIYVLDAENRRVQVLNSDLSYVTEIRFAEGLKQEVKLLDSIAVDEYGNIYMASTNFGYSQILCYKNQEREFKELGKNFCGTVAERGGKVFTVNLGVTTGKKNDITGWRTGMNFLYSVTPEGMEMVCELPYGITPLGLLIEEEGIVCVSAAYRTVDYYDFSGTYKYSIVFNEMVTTQCNLAEDENGTIYLGLPFAKKVLKIERWNK